MAYGILYMDWGGEQEAFSRVIGGDRYGVMLREVFGLMKEQIRQKYREMMNSIWTTDARPPAPVPSNTNIKA